MNIVWTPLSKILVVIIVIDFICSLIEFIANMRQKNAKKED